MANFILYIRLICKSDHEVGKGSKIPKNLTTWFIDDPYVSIKYSTDVCKTFNTPMNAINYLETYLN